MGAQVQTSVTTGQALHDAVANGAVIQLGADIEIGSLLNIQPNMTVTLDLITPITPKNGSLSTGAASAASSPLRASTCIRGARRW
jgi:hypothetical protein